MAARRPRPTLVAVCATTVAAAAVWAAVPLVDAGPSGRGAGAAAPVDAVVDAVADDGAATAGPTEGDAAQDEAGSRLPRTEAARAALRRHRAAWRSWAARSADASASSASVSSAAASDGPSPTPAPSTTPSTPTRSADAPSPTPNSTGPSTSGRGTMRTRTTTNTSTGPASTSGTTTAAGSAAAPVGDLPGWRQVFLEDFTTDAPLGSFADVYGARWSGYEGGSDTSRAGRYSEARTVSVAGGVLDVHLRTEGGTPLVAAPVPLVGGRWGGQLHGRYSVRFRSDPVPGYKTAWLLWPDSDAWADGEIDFPEGALDGTMAGFVHCPGDPSKNCLSVDTGATYAAWHTATVEWTASGVVFLLDGREVGRTRTSPTVPMHWVLQTETDGGTPPASAAGHVQVDWVSIWAPA